MIFKLALSALAGLALTAFPARAQQLYVSISGVAYDSLRGAPLGRAQVTLAGTAKTVTTDNRGRFRMDSVPTGAATFVVQHDSLDAAGFSGLRARTTVGATQDWVVVALPSFETIWRLACGNAPAGDSGLVYGTVRDIHGTPLGSGATVDASWLDLSVGNANDISQRRWKRSSSADETGSYALCGVPAGVNVRNRASSDSLSSGLIDLLQLDRRITRRDLFIGPLEPAAGERGTIVGLVTSANGVPLADVRVLVGDVPEVRSNANGRFAMASVPAGTRQVEFLSLGMSPVVVAANVTAGDTISVSASLRKITTLEAMRVTASKIAQHQVQLIQERAKVGMGFQRDSTAVGLAGTMRGAFGSMPSLLMGKGKGSSFSLLLPNGRGGFCLAELWVDGIREREMDLIDMMIPGDVAVIEVYPRRLLVPLEFVGKSECGVIAVWTKRVLSR